MIALIAPGDRTIRKKSPIDCFQGPNTT